MSHRILSMDSSIRLVFFVLAFSWLLVVGREVTGQSQDPPTDRTIENKSLASELVRMGEQDQLHRKLLHDLMVAMSKNGGEKPSEEYRDAVQKQEAIDRVNQSRLVEIIEQHGWPGASMVGEAGSRSAFLILQHSGLELQEKYFPLLRKAVQARDARPGDVAMLEDRILMRQGKKQVYGTQLQSTPESNGKLVLYPIENEATVDDRRASVGLPPLREYLKLFGLEVVPTGSDPSTTDPSISSVENKPLIAYVGTFSSPLRDTLPTQVDLPPGNGRGIHLFRVDRQTGAFQSIGIEESGTSPSCLVVNSAGTCLYTANETDRMGDSKEGSVSSYRIDRKTGKLSFLNKVRSGGAGPTFVSLHPDGKFLLVANYFGGSVSVLPVLTDGALGEPTDTQVDEGKIGPTRAKNAPLGSFAWSGHDRTHAHMIQADPKGKRVLHVDLGLDRLYVWGWNGAGKLEKRENTIVTLPPGDGPRHFHFHPNGKWFYSLQEEGSTVSLFFYDELSGDLTFQRSWSTLPPGFAGSNFCSEILVTSSGKYLYVGNRLHDSIGIFAIGEAGSLTYVGEEWTRGNYPRSFSFDPSERFLYCCNQRGDNVAVFRVSPDNGGLQFTGQYVPVGNPSHIVFADLAK